MTETSADAAVVFIKRALIISAALLAALIATSLAFYSARTAFSLAAGSCIAMASFTTLALSLVRSAGRGARSGAAVAVLGIFKMAFIGAAIWWLFSRKTIDPLAFLAGFTTMVVALIIEGLRMER